MTTDFLRIRRFGRICFWHDPALYRWIGRLRGRGDCMDLDFDLWIDGFPGSASALATAAFQQANPGVRLGGRRHLPPFILHALYNLKPGIFLMRQPEDAVISWAILSNRNLGECLDYYNDFHRVLAPNASRLFVVTFEELVTQFATAIDGFNIHFRTDYAAPAQNPAATFSPAEQPSPRPNSSAGELRVARPPNRSSLRNELHQQLHGSVAFRRKLERARQLYAIFAPGNRRAQTSPLNLTTRHLPAIA